MAPRPSRNLSSLNLYHVLVTGNNNEDVFIDDEDKQQILNILSEKQAQGDCELFAFCVLPNKANFMLKVSRSTLAELMRQINISYAQYFNRKYGRCGHVFQDRYRSVPVDSQSQFHAVKRYISVNPVIEGYAGSPDAYDFAGPKGEGAELCEVFGYYDNCISNLEKIAKSMIAVYMNTRQISPEHVKAADSRYRAELVALVRESTGFSIRKISRLLDLNRGEVYRIIQIQSSKEGL